MTKRILGIGMAAGMLLLVPTFGVRAQEVADSVAHPIRTTCGVSLDPVGFVMARADDLGLDDAQREQLGALGQRLAAENRPLGERFWALAGRRETMTERSAILFELRVNYRIALGEIRQILTPDQWRAGFDREAEDEHVRCLARSIPSIIGARS